MINPNDFGSAEAGSPNNAPAFNTNNQDGPAGQAQNGGQNDYKAMYEELEKKLGTQGQELGEYRTFFTNTAPLFEKLDSSPELVQAILDGKIDDNLAKAVYEGKINIADATEVSKAAGEVKADLGKDYKATSADDMTRLIEEKMSEMRREIDESSDLKNFEEQSRKFIESTPDFIDHADKIDKWLDEHDITDIETAYYAVKGQMSTKEAKSAADRAATERAKEMFSNAQGGSASAQFAPDGTRMVDNLIATRSSANIF